MGWRIVGHVGPDVGEEEIRALGADDESLHAPNQEMVPLVFGSARGAEEVGSAAGLRQRLCGHQLALQHRLQVAPLLFLGAEDIEGLTDDGGHHEGAARRDPQSADRLHGCTFGHPVHPPAPVFLRKA